MRFRIASLMVLASVLTGMLLLGSSCSGGVVIPPPPYVPKSPAEDIVSFQAYIKQGNPNMLHLDVTFATATPPSGQTLEIIVTRFQGGTEIVLGLYIYGGAAMVTHPLDVTLSDGGSVEIAVYAMVGTSTTDREPKTGFFSVSFNQGGFYSAVGGVVLPTNALIVLAPYLAMIGLVATAAIAVKKRRN